MNDNKLFKQNEDGSITLFFKEGDPIKVGDKELTEITMRKPLARDMRAVTSMGLPDQVAVDMTMASNLADLHATLDDMDKWPGSAVTRITMALRDFLY